MRVEERDASVRPQRGRLFVALAIIYKSLDSSGVPQPAIPAFSSSSVKHRRLMAFPGLLFQILQCKCPYEYNPCNRANRPGNAPIQPFG
jgi:hypothetical protein